MGSPKEAEEHRLVRERIVRDLGALSTHVEAEQAPRLLKLGRVQHLHTPIRATLRPETTDADVLARLHPTPATAGEPVAAARQWLGENEPFDRGWYAGPVGWVGRDAAEFAVALRCGLAVQSNLILFAGAGMVPGSEPAAEAREIEAKLSPFLRLMKV
jgi:menaquinone-specific isochorismate synthase